MRKLHRFIALTVLLITFLVTVPAISHAIPDGASGTWDLTWYVDTYIYNATFDTDDDGPLTGKDTFTWVGNRSGGYWSPSVDPYGFTDYNPTNPRLFTLVLHEWDGSDFGELTKRDDQSAYDGLVTGITREGDNLFINIGYDGGNSGLISLYNAFAGDTVKDFLAGDFDELSNPPDNHVSFQGEVELNRAAAVPEPSTMLLLGAGLLALIPLRKKFRP